ncbi:MAG: hypothetical protein JW749_06855 [Sedimentisphaerales bacterium]|nr:hypothetical protein [Sedimentisphaerales bacterium]
MHLRLTHPRKTGAVHNEGYKFGQGALFAVIAFMENGDKKKLIVLTFASGMFLGLLFTSVSFIAWRHKESRQALCYITAAQAKLIASNVECSLVFEDRKSAKTVLETLKTQNNIAFAGIYDSAGKLFAYYYRYDVRRQGFIPAPPSKVRFVIRNGYLVVSEPVVVDRTLVGTVCLWAQI